MSHQASALAKNSRASAASNGAIPGLMVTPTNTGSLTPKRSILARTFSVRERLREKENRNRQWNDGNAKLDYECEITLPSFSSTSKSDFSQIKLTKQLFLDSYSKGKWNLSVVPKPPCLKELSMLKAPLAYHESARMKAVLAFMERPQWKDTDFFIKKLERIAKTFKCTGAALSLIGDNYQIVKYAKNLGFKECPRTLSIDAHAILSSDFFVLLDASQDWRTGKYPMVKGAPFIKFYIGVPLISLTGHVIGVLSVFDVYPRNNFIEANIKILKCHAAEVMRVLSGPTLPKIGLSSETTIQQRIGRATSQDHVGRTNLVYERDGSGTAYSQNLHYRISKSDLGSSNKHLGELWRCLITCRDSRAGASLLCSKLHELLNYDFIYVMEIRVVEPYKASAELLPLENRIDAESFPYIKNLVKNGEEKIVTRVMGSHGLNDETLKFEPLIHYYAFVSDFGILYKSYENTIRFKSGFCMPFYKRESTIVRRKPVTARSKVVRGSSVDIYLRSGGFLIAGFNEDVRGVSDSDIDEVVQHASLYRHIYLGA